MWATSPQTVMKIIKTILFLAVCQLIFTGAAAAQQTFDAVTFTAPRGWQKEAAPDGDAYRISKEDTANNVFALITLFKAVPAGADPKANFTAAWSELVQKTLGAATPQMQPAKTQNGWLVETGLAAFEKEGLSGVALLTTATTGGKMANILLVTNTDVYQPEITSFFASVKLAETAVGQSKTSVAQTTTRPANLSMGKPELWSTMQLRGVDVPGFRFWLSNTVTERYVVYPNGDYFPHVPYEGLLGVDRSFQAESWGKFTMQGNKGRFKNNYDQIAVTRRSATHMEKDGYTMGFYKFLPVDGLRIDGAYTHVSPDWGKDAKLDYLSGPGCQFTISFKKDGTFDDRGIFSPSRSNCTGGKGTYSIENFTITFKYSDGRVVHRLFTAPPTRNPATYTETYYIGHTAHYKKMN